MCHFVEIYSFLCQFILPIRICQVLFLQKFFQKSVCRSGKPDSSPGVLIVHEEPVPIVPIVRIENAPVHLAVKLDSHFVASRHYNFPLQLGRLRGIGAGRSSI